MDNWEIIQKTEQFIGAKFRTEGSGHDWFHVDRVRKMSLRLGMQEGSDLFITEMAALLHDLDDWKLTDHVSHHLSGTKEWLATLGVDQEVSDRVLQVIEDVSFKGAGIETPARSKEAAVVQDADRLDAIGAIGIARTFAYGGHKNRLIYDPEIDPVLHQDFQEYKNSTAPTVNHFYEKLLLLKNRMNTKSAKIIAEERHRFMEIFLKQFFEEWSAAQ